jgi:divalent metal cation (Fe/Co/Zn/Cd) transporter
MIKIKLLYKDLNKIFKEFCSLKIILSLIFLFILFLISFFIFYYSLDSNLFFNKNYIFMASILFAIFIILSFGMMILNLFYYLKEKYYRNN